MRFHFYCTAEELREVFLQVEAIQPLEYIKHGLNTTWHRELDKRLEAPFSSCREISSFGQCCWSMTTLWVFGREETEERGENSPLLLEYSGLPDQITDSRTLCEGRLLLLPEDKYGPDRVLYQTIQSCFKKRCGFHRAGRGWMSPSVYKHRREYLFWAGNPGVLAGPWRLDEQDRAVPLSCNAGEGAERSARLQRVSQEEREIVFFAAKQELLGLLEELGRERSLLYFERSGSWQNGPCRSPFELRGFQAERGSGIIVYDEQTRQFVNLAAGGPWEGADRMVDVGRANHFLSPYGNGLYRAFAGKIRAWFHRLEEPRYGPFYLSPALWPRRRELILNLKDPRFRIDEEDRLVHVWRQEWEAL